MLKKIELKNFKPFNTRQLVPMAPITLLYGPNSAGKSSVMQSLLLLKQTVAESDFENAALFPKGRLVDLGNFREMVYGHDVKEKITIALSIGAKESGHHFFRNMVTKNTTCDYEMVFSFDSQKRIQLDTIQLGIGNTPLLQIARTDELVENMGYSLSKSYGLRGIDRTRYVQSNRKVAVIKWINDEHPYVIHALKRINSEVQDVESGSEIIERADIQKIADEVIFLLDGFIISGSRYRTLNRHRDPVAYRRQFHFSVIEDIIGGAMYLLRETLDSIVYLGPLREYPERHYIFSGSAPSTVGKSGKYTNDVLYQNKNLVEEVNEWMDRFGINYRVAVNRLSDEYTTEVYSLRLIDKINGISASSLDVGFGISQLLPIIVQGLICKNSIICIEQPEIHIHPRLQTVFGSFINECFSRGNQFIIETHSEHIMLRLQKLIRQKELSNNDISVIYVDRKDKGASCLQLRLNDRGAFIDAWPDGFFEEDFAEVFS